jgi:hypothetical protein
MKRSLALAVAVVAALCLGGAASPATAPAPRTAEVPSPVPFTVDAGPGDQTDPHVSSSTVSYTSQVNGGSAIDVYDVAAGTRSQVPQNGGMDFLSDVNGSQVTYTHLTTQSEVALYDASTGQTRILAQTLPSNRRESRIGGSTVAWQDFDYTGDVRTPEIAVDDLSTGTVTRLTNDSLLDKDPAVSPDGGTVVWTKCQPNATGCTIWEATHGSAGWQAVALTDAAQGEAALPDTDGHTVVYSIVAGGDEDVYWQDAGGGTAHRLALPGQQTNPNISNGVITFEQLDTSTQVPNYDLYAYDIATGTLYRLTSDPTDETLNDVWVSPDRLVRVVWTTAQSDYNIYGETFQLPRIPGTVSLAPAGGSQAVGTAASVTATVDDPSGGAVAGALVSFTLGGAVSGSGSCMTAADGTCSFAYQGPAAPGTVTISAYADTNESGDRDEGEPGATAERSFVAAQYGFGGFLAPVAGPPAVNRGHAGRTYALKWQLTDAQGAPVTDLSAIASITYQKVSCGSFAGEQTQPVAADSSGNSGLRYDATANAYVYNWSTPRAAGCYTLVLSLDSGQTYDAYFQLT